MVFVLVDPTAPFLSGDHQFVIAKTCVHESIHKCSRKVSSLAESTYAEIPGPVRGKVSIGRQLNTMSTCEYFLDAIYKYPPDS
jgi:hypothetical protein